MARVVRRERCPECAKVGKDRHGDNLAVYDTGNEHCFSCGHHTGTIILPRRATGPQVETLVTLPGDICTQYPVAALMWLKSFNITFSDLVQNKVCWSPHWERLIFPYENSWQGRYFGLDNTKAKWYTRGNIQNVIHVFNCEYPDSGDNRIVLVEDIVSAIRVSHSGEKVAPLFGSHVSPIFLRRVLRCAGKLLLWLDYDKRDYSYRTAVKLNALGIDCNCMITEKDPKEYSNEEIKNLLTNP